ncbi:MAG: hypothetical protein DI639_02490 [Leifsonia xyli]|nr:MAG: hypothetical protein DI639_02490 [Leifsonia xyli]
MVGVGAAHAVEVVGPLGDRAGRRERAPVDVHPVPRGDPGGDAVGVDLVEGGDEGDGSNTHVRYPT